MEKLKEVQGRLAEAHKLRATFNAMLSETAELIVRSKRDHKSAVLAGKPDAELKKLEDEIAEAERRCGRLDIKIAAADEEIQTLERERDEAVRADGLARLRAKSLQVIAAVGRMDEGINFTAAARAEVDALLGECADMAHSLGLPTQRYQHKFQVELRRGLDWLIFGTSENGAIWSAQHKLHYSLPLSRQIENLLLVEVEQADAESSRDNVTKLEKAS
jgi:chromosome segregation ATPase